MSANKLLLRRRGLAVATTRYKYALDGVNDFIRVPHFADLNFGTGAFTWHWWMQCANQPNNNFNLWISHNDNQNYLRFLWASESGGNNRSIQVYIGLSNVFTYPINTGFDNSTSPNNLKYSYNHVAIVKESGGTFWLYINGIRYDTGTDNRDLSSLTGDLYIQGLYNQWQQITVDRLRIIKGQALWTGGTQGQTVFDPNTIDYSTFSTNGIYFPSFKPANWNTDQGGSTFIAQNAIAGKPNGIIHGRTTADIATFYQNI